MKNSPEKNSVPPEETKYLLIDGAAVSPEEAAQAGRKACRILLGIASLLVLLGILLGIRFALDISTLGTGWAMAVTAEAVVLGFAALLFILSFRLDPEQYGLSVLNLRKRMGEKKAGPSLLDNGISADNVLELHSLLGNVLYCNLTEKRWQYRLKGKLSKPLSVPELASFDILRNGLKYQPDRPEATTPDGNSEHFGILLRFTAPEKPSLEIDCHSRQVALECRDVLENLLK